MGSRRRRPRRENARAITSVESGAQGAREETERRWQEKGEAFQVRTQGDRRLCVDRGHADPRPPEGQRSYGQSRAAASKDAEGLQAAAKKDTADMMSDKDGIKKSDAACQEAYAKNAEKINNITDKQYDDWLQKCLDACKD
jgi:hypothetical protein